MWLSVSISQKLRNILAKTFFCSPLKLSQQLYIHFYIYNYTYKLYRCDCPILVVLLTDKHSDLSWEYCAACDCRPDWAWRGRRRSPRTGGPGLRSTAGRRLWRDSWIWPRPARSGGETTLLTPPVRTLQWMLSLNHQHKSNSNLSFFYELEFLLSFFCWVWVDLANCVIDLVNKLM